MKYIAILYKPHEDDYCMGCRMGSFPAEHTVMESDFQDNIVEEILNNINLPHEVQDADYELTLFVDGIRVLDQDNPLKDSWFDDSDHPEAKVIFEKLKNRVIEKEEEIQTLAKEALRLRIEREAEAEKQREIAKRNELLEKYPLTS